MEHVAIENPTLDWDNAKKLEQTPDWRMRGIKEAITIMSTLYNFNRPQGERHTLSCLAALPRPPITEDKGELAGGGGALPYKATAPHTSRSSLIVMMTIDNCC